MRKTLLRTVFFIVNCVVFGAFVAVAQQGPSTGSEPGSLILTGKVAVAGGVLPWDPIPVVVTCQGKAAYNGQTDTDGNFKIEATSTTKDGAGNPLYPTLTGCTVSASLTALSRAR